MGYNIDTLPKYLLLDNLLHGCEYYLQMNNLEYKEKFIYVCFAHLYKYNNVVYRKIFLVDLVAIYKSNIVILLNGSMNAYMFVF